MQGECASLCRVIALMFVFVQHLSVRGEFKLAIIKLHFARGFVEMIELQIPRFGKLTHISLENLHGLIRKHPEWPIALAPMVAHLPCSYEAIAQSVVKLEGRMDAIPDFSEGYRIWSEAVERGEAGVYSVAVSQIVGAIEAGRSKFANQLEQQQASSSDSSLALT